MSVCIEQNNFKNNVNNNQFSQTLSDCERSKFHSHFELKKRNIFQLIKVWLSRSRQRKALAALDDRLLADIDYTQAQARDESRKPFWK